MVEALTVKMQRLIRDNPRAVRHLLQTMDEFPQDQVIEVMSDDGVHILTFRRVHPD